MSTPGRRPWGYWGDDAPLIYRHTLVPPAKPPYVRVRGNSDKTGQGTRQKIRTALLKRWGPYCHLCLAWGLSEAEASIDLTLVMPDPGCFTRDHIKPRSLRGQVYSLRNQRPAHNRCNSFRGNKTMEQIIECRPEWVRPEEAA